MTNEREPLWKDASELGDFVGVTKPKISAPVAILDQVTWDKLQARIAELEARLDSATITADQRGTLIDGMEEAIDEMKEEINTLSYCEACGGEMMIEVTWEMPNVAGGYRKIPCTRCDGTGREYVPRLTARITELEQEQIALWHTINTQATYAEELEAQLAERWEPVKDGTYHTDGPELISIKDNEWRVWGSGYPLRVELQRGYALCRLVTKGKDDGVQMGN